MILDLPIGKYNLTLYYSGLAADRPPAAGAAEPDGVDRGGRPGLAGGGLGGHRPGGRLHGHGDGLEGRAPGPLPAVADALGLVGR